MELAKGPVIVAEEMTRTVWRSREKTVLSLIYARRPQKNQVLLGMKKRGFGSGKFNGFGGKLEASEAIEDSVIRELYEESGLQCSREKIRWCGTLTYVYDTKPKAMEVHVYDLEHWQGDPVETDEMKPQWFSHAEIPLADMWADDEYWLVQYLEGELPVPFGGRFRFKGHEGSDSWVVLEKSVGTLLSKPGRALGNHPVLHPGAAMIISTISFAQAPGARPLESFVRFHLLKGFALIMLVIDDARDTAALDAVKKFPQDRVLSRVRDEAHLEEQRLRCASFAELSPLLDLEVSARQMLDAELGMWMAPKFGCNWVVCLDSDELFYTQETSVRPHFEALAHQGVTQMTYLNHEGVPEVPETEDYFATTTLFRRHHFAVPLTSEARDGLRFWRNRTTRNQYLLFYDNGKSACRSAVGAVPKSQHLWRLPAGQRSVTALADPRRLEVNDYIACEDPCVLHFPVCGLAWLLAKYRTLGDFPDAWLGGRIKLPASFHGDARDAFIRDGPEAVEALFRKEVLLDDPAVAATQISSQVCLRITEHAQLLEAIPTTVTAELSSLEQPCILSSSTATTADVGSADSGPQGIELGWILSKTVGYL